MDENRFDDITYEEDWQSSSQPQYAQTVRLVENYSGYDDSDDETSENDARLQGHKKPKSPKQWLIIVQLILCFLAFAGFFALKEIGGDLYKSVVQWYKTELNNSMIMNNDISNIDLDQFLNGIATNDEG